MKILVYGLNFAPELTGIGRFSGDMAAWLAARGHEVRAVTAPPYYPAWRIAEGHSGWRWRSKAARCCARICAARFSPASFAAISAACRGP